MFSVESSTSLISPLSALGFGDFGDWSVSGIGSRGSGLSRSVRRRYSVSEIMCLMDPISCLVSLSLISTSVVSDVAVLENWCVLVPIVVGSRETGFPSCFPSTIRDGMGSSSNDFEG